MTLLLWAHVFLLAALVGVAALLVWTVWKEGPG
jgi:hypothetical protein